jgi:hypothetical protein
MLYFLVVLPTSWDFSIETEEAAILDMLLLADLVVGCAKVWETDEAV